MSINTRVSFLIFCNIIINAIINILTPIIAAQYESIYFVIVMITSQLCIIICIVHIVIYFVTKQNLINNIFDNVKISIISGIFDAATSICTMYASNPNRTPINAQIILSNTSIITSVILTKLVLNKQITHDLKYIVFSLVMLMISIVITLTPTWNDIHLLWILLYFFNVIFTCACNIYQEKYITDTRINTQKSYKGIISFLLVSAIVQVIILAMSFWLEYLIGYSNNPTSAFVNSLNEFFFDKYKALTLELLIGMCIMNYVISFNLNDVSTNYNMISLIVVGPIVAIFFNVFNEFDSYVNYNIFVTVISLACSIFSVVLWIKGEKHVNVDQSNNVCIGEKNYGSINDIV